MPKIQTYEAHSDISGPQNTRRATADDFGGAIAKGAMQAGEAIGHAADAVQKQAARSELSDIHAKMSQAHGEYTTYLQDQLRTADPADKGLADRFLQKYDDHVSKIGDNISTPQGRDLYNSLAAQQRAHFLEEAKHGQADLAGVKAKEDYVGGLNSLSSSLLTNPSAFETVKSQNEAYLKSYVDAGGNTAAAAKLKVESEREIAKSAVAGWADLDPKFAKQQLDSGKYDQYMNGDVKREMYAHVSQSERAKEVEQERRQREADRKAAQQQMLTQNKFLQDMQDGKLTTTDILHSNLDAFGSGSKNQFIEMLDKHSRAENKIKTEAPTFLAQWDRIHLPDGDPRKLTDESELNGLLGHGLDLQGIKQLRDEIQTKRTPEGKIEEQSKGALIAAAKTKLTKSGFGIPDPDGDMNYQAFLQYFLNEYDRQRKAGKTANQLLDEGSPDYMGKQIDKFVRTPQQIIKGMANKLGSNGKATQEYGPPAPISTLPPDQARKPGESIGQWRERTKH